MRTRLHLFFVVLACSSLVGACSKRVDEPADNAFKPSASTPPPPLPPPPKTLETVDEKVGTGRACTDGDHVKVLYTGTLMNGKEFDSSAAHGGEPFELNIGGDGVIKGWSVGIKGMKVGGKRRLTIPPDMGYGEEGHPPAIPPNAGLIFEVELVSIE